MMIKLVLHPILASLAQIWAQKMFFENFTFYYMLDIVASYHCLEFYASYCMRTLLQAIIVSLYATKRLLHQHLKIPG